MVSSGAGGGGGLPQAPPGFLVVYTDGSAAEEAPGVAFAGYEIWFVRGEQSGPAAWGAGPNQHHGGAHSFYMGLSVCAHVSGRRG